MNTYSRHHGEKKTTLNDERETIKRGFKTQIDYLHGIYWLLIIQLAVDVALFLLILTLSM